MTPSGKVCLPHSATSRKAATVPFAKLKRRWRSPVTSPKSQKGRHSKVASSASDRPAQAGYEIDMTYSAEKVYVGLYKLAKEAEQRGDYTSQRCTTFNMVREAIKTIIPNDPFNKHYALTDELANIF